MISEIEKAREFVQKRQRETMAVLGRQLHA
jgi:hypothetical protein